MKRKMYLRLTNGMADSADYGQQCSWLVFDEDRQNEAIVHEGSLSDAAEEVAGCIVIVFVPAEEVLLTTVNVPSRNRRDIVNAIPYALEDQLAEDIDALHFAIGERDENGAIPVAVVADGQMSEWLKSLRDVGIEPNIMTTELFGIALQAQHWSILVEEKKVLLRDGLQSGFVFDAENINQHLAKVWRESEEQPPLGIKVLDVRYEAQDLSSIDTGAIEEPLSFELSLTGADIDYQRSAETALQLMAKNFDANAVINLIQGQHSRQEQLDRVLRPWLATAVLLVVLLVMGGGKAVGEYYSLSAQKEALEMAVEGIYRETFPEAKRVVNARIQMQQKLDALKKSDGSSDNGFLALLSNVGATLKNYPAEINRLVYRNNNLDVAMTMSSMQLLEKMEKSLEQGGALSVEIRSATQKNDKVEAQLKIKRGTP